MGAIVGWYWPPFFSIRNVRGPIGVKADIKNTGEIPANNVEWSMTITGGTFGLVNKYASGTRMELAPSATEAIWSGLFFGLGNIFIEITADADNAQEVTVSKEAFLLGPFVFGIK
jgi:hypothetical protein